MKKNLGITQDFLTICCDECYGDGEVSECCGDVVDSGKCSSCGRFCRTHVCFNCEGNGHIEFRVGDDVDIFVCGWSDEYLKEALYLPKNVDDTKTFQGKITKIIDDFTVQVKVKWNGLHNIKIIDLGV